MTFALLLGFSPLGRNLLEQMRAKESKFSKLYVKAIECNICLASWSVGLTYMLLLLTNVGVLAPFASIALVWAALYFLRN